MNLMICVKSKDLTFYWPITIWSWTRFYVCIFPEGNRSFNGLTGDILPTIGRVAGRCGMKLVTYRIEGGYLNDLYEDAYATQQKERIANVVGKRCMMCMGS